MGGGGSRSSGEQQQPTKQKQMWEFQRNIPGRIGIFPRHAKSSKEVRWFEVAPFCVSHTATAWEEREREHPNDLPIIVIVTNNIGFENFAPTFSTETPSDPDANLHEYRMNLNTGTVTETTLLRIRSDFPNTNSKWLGKDEDGASGRKRYVYAGMLNYQEPNHAPFIEGIYKYDLLHRSWRKEMFESFVCGGEPFFVPKLGGGKEEDDGYVVVLVNNFQQRQTELRVYDAVTFGDGASLVATIICPRRVVPLGTHGIWIGEDEVVL